MQEVNIKDRVPRYPGRYKITPVEGKPDFFDLARADEPTEPGTPLDKSTLDSIIQSRLTGRFYVATANRVTVSSVTSTTNPIPQSGWVDETITGAVNGSYVIEASGARSNTFSPYKAFDGDPATSWQDSDEITGETWISVDFGIPIIITQNRVYWTSTDGDDFITRLQGSNGTNWVDIASRSGSMTAAITWDTPNNVAYSKYRLSFRQGSLNPMRLYEWAVTGWATATYRNELQIASGVPIVWGVGQRIMVETPSYINTVGVTINTLNGIRVNTILQPSKRYELTYNGVAFDAKGV